MGAGIYLFEYAKRGVLRISLELVLKFYHLYHQLLLDCLVTLFLLFNFNTVSQLSLVPLP